MKIRDFKLGATGSYPYGKLNDSDEGELRMAVAADHRDSVVKVMFGKPIAWLGLPSDVARDLAKMLIDKADELDKRKQ